MRCTFIHSYMSLSLQNSIFGQTTWQLVHPAAVCQCYFQNKTHGTYLCQQPQYQRLSIPSQRHTCTTKSVAQKHTHFIQQTQTARQKVCLAQHTYNYYFKLWLQLQLFYLLITYTLLQFVLGAAQRASQKQCMMTWQWAHQHPIADTTKPIARAILLIHFYQRYISCTKSSCMHHNTIFFKYTCSLSYQHKTVRFILNLAGPKGFVQVKRVANKAKYLPPIHIHITTGCIQQFKLILVCNIHFEINYNCVSMQLDLTHQNTSYARNQMIFPALLVTDQLTVIQRAHYYKCTTIYNELQGIKTNPKFPKLPNIAPIKQLQLSTVAFVRSLLFAHCNYLKSLLNLMQDKQINCTKAQTCVKIRKDIKATQSGFAKSMFPNYIKKVTKGTCESIILIYVCTQLQTLFKTETKNQSKIYSSRTVGTLHSVVNGVNVPCAVRCSASCSWYVSMWFGSNWIHCAKNYLDAASQLKKIITIMHIIVVECILQALLSVLTLTLDSIILVSQKLRIVQIYLNLPIQNQNKHNTLLAILNIQKYSTQQGDQTLNYLIDAGNFIYILTKRNKNLLLEHLKKKRRKIMLNNQLSEKITTVTKLVTIGTCYYVIKNKKCKMLLNQLLTLNYFVILAKLVQIVASFLTSTITVRSLCIPPIGQDWRGYTLQTPQIIMSFKEVKFPVNYGRVGRALHDG